MDGAELLTEVMNSHPAVVRIVLSGQSDQETRLRAAGPTHQFLTKPCTEEALRSTVVRACALRDLLGRDSLRTLVTRLDALPSMPSVYQQLQQELLLPEPSIARVGDLISRDVAMTAKLLQLVNSSFFGAPRHVASPVEATSLLGLNVVRELVISENIFASYKGRGVAGFSLEQMRDHAAATAECARAIAIAEGQDGAWLGDAQLAGQLHDIGQLVLAANLPDLFEQSVRQAAEQEVETWRAELDLFGATHAEVGAYLLGIWGIPDTIVEAVAHHHRPMDAASRSFSAVTAVHVANVLAHETPGDEQTASPPLIDEAYLDELGLLHRLSVWREACGEALKAA
jgi:HD-like signal output (HDOD) protein